MDGLFPYQFLSASLAVPQWEPVVEPMMLNACVWVPKFDGDTAIVVDHSGSMRSPVSSKSEISRFDAAASLAILARETCTGNVRVFTFADKCLEVPPRRGFALRDAIKSFVDPTGTRLGLAVRSIYAEFPTCQRMFVITDEQSMDRPPAPRGRGYIVNVGSSKNGVGYESGWIHLDGWSEHVLKYANELERNL